VRHVVRSRPTGSAAASARSNPTRSNPAARLRQCPTAPRYTHGHGPSTHKPLTGPTLAITAVGDVLQERRSVPFPAGIEDQDWHDRHTEVSLTDALRDVGLGVLAIVGEGARERGRRAGADRQPPRRWRRRPRWRFPPRLVRQDRSARSSGFVRRASERAALLGCSPGVRRGSRAPGGVTR
jgi:hypothetical protein